MPAIDHAPEMLGEAAKDVRVYFADGAIVIDLKAYVRSKQIEMNFIHVKSVNELRPPIYCGRLQTTHRRRFVCTTTEWSGSDVSGNGCCFRIFERASAYCLSYRITSSEDLP